MPLGAPIELSNKLINLLSSSLTTPYPITELPAPSLLTIASLRNEWSFSPSSLECKLDYFTDSDLNSILQHKSIYILGNSKERDMILHDADKAYIHHSVILANAGDKPRS